MDKYVIIRLKLVDFYLSEHSLETFLKDKMSMVVSANLTEISPRTCRIERVWRVQKRVTFIVFTNRRNYKTFDDIFDVS